MNLLDFRDNDAYEQPGNTLLIKQDPDQTYVPNFAKPGDVGLDLPVKIIIDQVKFTESGEEPGRLRNPMLSPNLDHFIFPDGLGEIKRPFLEVPAHGWAEIPTGLSVKLPDDAWGLVKGRSSTAWRLHLQVTPGTIDPGYTGLLGVLVYNPNNVPVRVFEYDPETGEGDRLGQLILIPAYPLKNIALVDTMPMTDRGDTGFGSTTRNSARKNASH